MEYLFPEKIIESHDGPKDSLLTPSTHIWKLLVESLKNFVSEEEIKTWILPITVRTDFHDELTLIVPHMHHYQKLVDHYLAPLERCKSTLGLDSLTIRVDIENTGAKTEKPTHENFFTDEDEQNKQEMREEIAIKCEEAETISVSSPYDYNLSRPSKLNPHYTFENFVRGPSNQFALATCLNVAENPGQNYNPLFLYGSTGLGKTHLQHAVGNRVLKLYPEAIITYISSERFMNEMIYCIRHNKMWDFRQKYRHCDVFLMDDIQFISGNKAATQEEFFHTFNSLYEAKKQIIITSDLFPQDIPDIEERLRNRFQWGLIADIQPPDIEHRIAILFSKAEQLKVKLSYEVAEYLATHAKRNVRELEGTLHRLAAFAALHGRAVNKELAQETFTSFHSENEKKIGADVIQKIVAEHFKLKVSDLKSKKRHRTLTLPRQIAMFLTRKYTKSSYPDIGECFGGKDHTTVLHAVKKITQEKLKDINIKMQIETLERQIEKFY